MSNISNRKTGKKISSSEFDEKFERGENIFKFLNFRKATVVKRVNVDFPVWMLELLDKEALKLNVSRQAIVKMWIYNCLIPTPHIPHKAVHH